MSLAHNKYTNPLLHPAAVLPLPLKQHLHSIIHLWMDYLQILSLRLLWWWMLLRVSYWIWFRVSMSDDCRYWCFCWCNNAEDSKVENKWKRTTIQLDKNWISILVQSQKRRKGTYALNLSQRSPSSDNHLMNHSQSGKSRQKETLNFSRFNVVVSLVGPINMSPT